MSANTIGIPRVLWESFETTLWTQSRSYVREIARLLGVKEDVLLREVLPSKDTLQVYIQESPEDCPYDLECKAVIQAGSDDVRYGIRCRRTIEKGHSYCSKHVIHRQECQARVTAGLPIPKILHRLRGVDVNIPLWTDDAGVVWNAGAEQCGTYDSGTRRLVLWT
jgi:hypothetical protein